MRYSFDDAYDILWNEGNCPEDLNIVFSIYPSGPDNGYSDLDLFVIRDILPLS